jgi:hypothetical protein
VSAFKFAISQNLRASQCNRSSFVHSKVFQTEFVSNCGVPFVHSNFRLVEASTTYPNRIVVRFGVHPSSHVWYL